MHSFLHLHMDSAGRRQRRRVVRFWPLLLAPLLIVAIELHASALRSRNEAEVIDIPRSLADLQARFREGDLDRDRILDYATDLSDLHRAGLIDDTLASGTLWDYTFGLSGSTFDWMATAVRTSGRAGTRNFAISTDGVVRFSQSGIPSLHPCSGGCAQ